MTRTPNNINWLDEYGVWSKTGYDIDVSLQFEQTKPDAWKDMPKDAFAYGRSFAQYFGPSGTHPLVGSVEIGNEPGNYNDAQYRTVFENMARGIREGDPKMPIATCNVVAGKPDKYTTNSTSLDGLQSLYDIINIHTYAFAEPYPTWRRSYPEDPSIKFLPPVTDTIAWRDAHAPGKQIWITEFGWDSTTKPNLPTGDFSRWVGSTDTQQAQYLVRSFLVFSALDVDRAYIYYYDDDDAPTLHASSGLTRHLKPKPSFYAVSHLYATLGAYRFARAVVQEAGNLYAYEFQNGTNSKERIWAVWSPTGKNREAEVVLPAPGGKIVRAEQMPLQAGKANLRCLSGDAGRQGHAHGGRDPRPISGFKANEANLRLSPLCRDSVPWSAALCPLAQNLRAVTQHVRFPLRARYARPTRRSRSPRWSYPRNWRSRRPPSRGRRQDRASDADQQLGQASAGGRWSSPSSTIRPYLTLLRRIRSTARIVPWAQGVGRRRTAK